MLHFKLFKVDEKCFKAFIHKGRALTYLKNFDDAINEFEKAKKVDPKQENSINSKFFLKIFLPRPNQAIKKAPIFIFMCE